MVHGCTNTFTLYLALLLSCSGLVAVDLSFSSTQELNAVFHAIEPSLDTLKNVNLVQRTGWRLDDRFVEEALRCRQLQHIEGLVIDSIEIDYRSRLNGSVSIPLKSFQLITDMNFHHARRLLPEKRSALREISLDVYGIGPNNFTNLLAPLSSSCKTLEIVCQRREREYQPYLTTYSLRIDLSCPIPVAGFQTLTSLTHLKLRRFQGPSLGLLETLCNASPHLVTVDFAQSSWIANPSDPPSESISNPDLIFPELEVLANLQQLHSLHYLHLGYLPTIDSNAYPILAQGLKERKVEMEWNSCRPRDDFGRLFFSSRV
ncbi:hypothetical protein JCM5353_006921 [Sporobolomyces roseus]